MVHSSLAVGTPDYLSPEILRAVEGAGGYGPECDWWALGICAYEMLLGTTPFYAETISETYAKIIHFQEYFEFPSSGPEVSDNACSFICGLICEREVRLGRKGFRDFRNHPLFCGLDWDSLHELPAPFLPEVSHPTDTSNFDILDNSLSKMETLSDVMEKGPIGVHLAFIGYSCTDTSQTGAIDHSKDIMLQTDNARVRDHESLNTPEKLRQLWQLKNPRSNKLPARLELPLTLEQSTVASANATTKEENNDQLLQFKEDLQNLRRMKAENVPCTEEMKGDRGNGCQQNEN